MNRQTAITKVIPATQASRQLGELIRKANTEQARFIIEKPGEPPAVIIGIEDYIRTFAPEPEVLTMIGEQSKEKGTNKLTMGEINREIAAYRKQKRTRNAKARA